MKQKVLSSLFGILCCFAFAACNQDMISDDDALLRMGANATTVYMQDFTPAGNELVGAEVMLTDKRDDITYRCIKMADGRWWMGENLKGRFGDYVERNPTEIYGLLYSWPSAQEYVPEGWSLPTDAEWQTLVDALGGASVAGGKMKEVGTSHWASPNTGATNESGFKGLPAGNCRIYDNTYWNYPTIGQWWAVEDHSAWHIGATSTSIGTGLTQNRAYRFSVRCILQEKETTRYMQDFTPAGNESVGTEVMLTDKRDGITYRCIKMVDGRWWMGENLKYNAPGSVVYNNDVANLDIYGRLYKWQEAMDATPENWNMPTDDEWKALEMALGMIQADADAATAWRNSGSVGTQLKIAGSSGIDLLLGGYQHINGSFLNLSIYGRFWTSVESGATAWDRDVYSNKVGVYRGTFSKAYRYSVRYILNQ